MPWSSPLKSGRQDDRVLNKSISEEEKTIKLSQKKTILVSFCWRLRGAMREDCLG